MSTCEDSFSEDARLQRPPKLSNGIKTKSLLRLPNTFSYWLFEASDMVSDDEVVGMF
jgi:hypothetical protein